MTLQLRACPTRSASRVIVAALAIFLSTIPAPALSDDVEIAIRRLRRLVRAAPQRHEPVIKKGAPRIGRRSLRWTFLRAPLEYKRVSSRFSKRRLHPIHARVMPHEGVDYAAPAGTPVWSVADGTVVYRGWNGGFGRLIRIRHDNGAVSSYGHLSRYRKGLRVGSRVEQREVIGFVGSSGVATGPHLDYRLKIAGQFVDPLHARPGGVDFE